MKKIKVNADLYVGDDKLLTTAEATNMIESEINNYATENPSYDDTEIRGLIQDVDDKIDTSGDGSKFLSDDGTYKLMGTDQINNTINQAITDGRISNYDDTEIRGLIQDVDDKIDTSGDGSKFLSDDGTYKLIGTDQINDVIDQAISDGRITNYDDTALTNKVNALKDKVDAITEITESEMNEIFTNAYNKVFGN